jgi:hypothetical protein
MTYYRYNDGMAYQDQDYKLIDLELKEYEIIKETKCGIWIRFPEKDRYLFNPIEHIQGKKFILEKYSYYDTSIKKKYAWPTKEEALISYIARKEKQIAILENQLQNAKEFLTLAKEMQNKEIK